MEEKSSLNLNDGLTNGDTKKNETESPDKEAQNVEEPNVPFFQIYRYATGIDKIMLIFGVISSMVTGVCQPLNILIFGDLTGNIISYAIILGMSDIPKEERDKAAEKFIEQIVDFAVYNSLIGLAMFVFSYLSTVLFNYSATRQMFTIRKLYFQSALNQDVSWYDMNQTGDFASRMSEDITKLEDGLGEKVPMFVNFQVGFLASLILALVKGWELALICLISLPVSMISLGIVAMLTSKLAKKEMDAYAGAGAIAEEVLSAIRTVVAFGGQHKETTRYSEKLIFAKNNNIRRSFLAGIGFGLLWFFIYGSYALAFWYGVGLVLEEKDLPANQITYDAGTMITVFFSVMIGSMNLGLSSPYIESFAIAKGAAAKIYSVIDNLPIINMSKGNGKKTEKIRGNIEFTNVHFDYPSRSDVKILRGLNLSIKSGETIALVGSSGCGKSTCIQLIQRFYDPKSGYISIDGNRLDELDLTWLRSNIGVVGQEPVLFGITIAENIRYGNMEASQDDIENAAKKANAHNFIVSLPQGYDTLVGERGAQLSGGQKQRIAIARALVRDPAILLLDEATSALDTNSEAKVQAALDNAGKGRTTIIVAHRLSTIRNAHRIVVIVDGKSVEEGTHDELMSKRGAYYNLVTTQISDDPGDAHEGDSVQMFDDKKASIVHDEFDVQEIIEDNSRSSASLWAIMKINKPEWWNILIGCVASLIIGGSMPIFAILFGDITAILAEDDEEYVRDETNLYSIFFVAAGLAIGFATFLQIYLFGIAGEKLTMRLRHHMFSSMLQQEMGWYDDKENGVGSLCAKLSGEAASVQGATGQRIGTILQSISTLILSVGLSMYYQWKLGLVTLAFTPIILVATFFQQRLMNVENTGRHSSLEKSTKTAVEAVGNIRTVASLGCENVFYQIYMAELLPYHEIAKKNVHIRGVVFALARSIMFFAYATCMYYGGILIRDENLEFEKVFKVSQSLIMGTVSIANALAFTPNLQKGLTAASRIFNLLNKNPKITDPDNPTDIQWEHGNIEYSRVFFSYPTRPSVRVLKGLDLSILEGKTVALVGPSGCGKSTVLQLLERYYDPLQGNVSVDSTDIREMKLSQLRSQIGVVSQEPNLFDRTIGENIAYGDNERLVQQEEIIKAARNANIHNFIASLPLGYDTRLGERGTQLSGGQKQRIAIARALVRNPKVLLLDEATSALDTESEKVVQEALDNAKIGRTCVTIAHRLTTIQDADVICVINQGRVAEMGTHTELLNLKGIYYTLHRLQKGHHS